MKNPQEQRVIIQEFIKVNQYNVNKDQEFLDEKREQEMKEKYEIEDKKRKEREKRVVHEGFKLLPRLLDRCIIRFRKQRNSGEDWSFMKRKLGSLQANGPLL